MNLGLRSEYANAFFDRTEFTLIVRTASSCKVDVTDRFYLLVQYYQFRNRTKDPETNGFVLIFTQIIKFISVYIHNIYQTDKLLNFSNATLINSSEDVYLLGCLEAMDQSARENSLSSGYRHERAKINEPLYYLHRCFLCKKFDKNLWPITGLHR